MALRRVGSTEQKLIFLQMFGIGWLALLESGDVVLAGREFYKAKNTLPGSMALRVYSPEGVDITRELALTDADIPILARVDGK